MRTIWLGSKVIQQYSLLDIQDKLQISKVTALKLVQTGKIRAQKIGRKWWINEDDLLEFLEGKRS
ncbi:MAG: helix-turn-helix domain-containing protein [Candidatus Aminicenantes bacterium]|jgi:excisionase family DNA binding protein|nr:helix-turn-helix domain-containing protein [Candidatus Aminicenantes bacterium]NOR11998.1 helix-turn-helix domain-containing protein [Candidatus Aminicenantes bacterium]